MVNKEVRGQRCAWRKFQAVADRWKNNVALDMAGRAAYGLLHALESAWKPDLRLKLLARAAGREGLMLDEASSHGRHRYGIGQFYRVGLEPQTEPSPRGLLQHDVRTWPSSEHCT